MIEAQPVSGRLLPIGARLGRGRLPVAAGDAERPLARKPGGAYPGVAGQWLAAGRGPARACHAEVGGLEEHDAAGARPSSGQPQKLLAASQVGDVAASGGGWGWLHAAGFGNEAWQTK